MTHAVEIEIRAGIDPGAAGALPVLSYRWHCCCDNAGPWQYGARAARSARAGGRQHVAAMERG